MVLLLNDLVSVTFPLGTCTCVVTKVIQFGHSIYIIYIVNYIVSDIYRIA